MTWITIAALVVNEAVLIAALALGISAYLQDKLTRKFLKGSSGLFGHIGDALKAQHQMNKLAGKKIQDLEKRLKYLEGRDEARSVVKLRENK